MLFDTHFTRNGFRNILILHVLARFTTHGEEINQVTRLQRKKMYVLKNSNKDNSFETATFPSTATGKEKKKIQENKNTHRFMQKKREKIYSQTLLKKRKKAGNLRKEEEKNNNTNRLT